MVVNGYYATNKSILLTCQILNMRWHKLVFLKKLLVIFTCVVLLFCLVIRSQDGGITYTGLNLRMNNTELLELERQKANAYVDVIVQQNNSCKLNVSKLRERINTTEQLDIVNKDPSILSRVRKGGSYSPNHCNATENVAIIVPYRDRAPHLNIFLRYMHSFLQKQSRRYTVFIVEQEQSQLFNRGLLLNVGSTVAMRLQNFTCLILHDVDLLPVNERNVYTCSPGGRMRHMASANGKYKYKLLYPRYFGGVMSISPGWFQALNGYSNLYFGWGQEDDDFYSRVRDSSKSLDTFDRLSLELGRYDALSHVQHNNTGASIPRNELEKTTKQRRKIDGLNSLSYERTAIEFKSLYTLIKVKTNETEYFNNMETRGLKCSYFKRRPKRTNKLYTIV